MKLKYLCYYLLLTAICIIGLSSTKSVNNSAGVTGSSTGCTCHGAPIGTVTLQGLDSTTAVANTVYPLTLTYNQGLTSKYWGLDIKCSAGTFTTTNGFRLSGNNEITHTTPFVSSASASYTFTGIKWNSGNLAPGTVVTFNYATVGSSTASGGTLGRPSSGSFTIVVGSSSAQCTSGNTTYSKTNTSVCTSQIPYNWNGLTCTSAGTYVKTLSGTNSQGCDSITLLNLKVNPLPVVNPIVGPSSFCLGNYTCFIDSTMYGYWSTSNSSIISTSANGCMISVQPGNVQLSYTVTDSNGCINSTQKWVSVIGSQTFANAYTSTPIVNLFDSIKLFNLSTIYGASYNWTGPNGFSSTLQNPVINNALAQSSGYYKVIVTNNTPGCSSITTDSVYVNVIFGYNIAGKIISPKGDAVKNADLLLKSSAWIVQFKTDSVAVFCVGNISKGNYTLSPFKDNDINKTNGVTAIDIALTQAHILGKNLLNSPYKLIAADVNGDGKVTALDIVYMKRLILGLDTTFYNTSTNQNRLWAFVDSSYQFADSTNPFPFKDSISYTNLNANQINQTFIGIKLGDVNWDWNPALARMKNPVFIRPKKWSVR